MDANTSEATAPDIVIATGDDNQTAGSISHGLRILFHPGSSSHQSSPEHTGYETIAAPLPRVLIENHPALRYISVEELFFDGALDMPAPEGAAVLVEDASGVPLVWQKRSNDQITIAFNFDPTLNDFFLSPYFPLMVHGAATHLAGRTRAVDSTYPTGEYVQIPGLRPGQLADLITPSTAAGQSTTISANDAKSFYAEHPGYYTAISPDQEWDLATSVLDHAESILSPVSHDTKPASISRGQSLWLTFALIALGVLIIEEALYHRRKVG